MNINAVTYDLIEKSGKRKTFNNGNEIANYFYHNPGEISDQMIEVYFNCDLDNIITLNDFLKRYIPGFSIAT